MKFSVGSIQTLSLLRATVTGCRLLSTSLPSSVSDPTLCTSFHPSLLLYIDDKQRYKDIVFQKRMTKYKISNNIKSKPVGTGLIVTYLLTYLGPPHEEQRPSTTSRHLTRSWAALITPFQQVSCCAISVSVLRLQLLRGRPLFLFPCGFHLRA